mmetsp:Transcript_16711/g.36518  ORF Transcript_16711/g.36518 Transcript_16711/m.36518 type:complete len:297 (+) Transcript_16711:1267-2157(+)
MGSSVLAKHGLPFLAFAITSTSSLAKEVFHIIGHIKAFRFGQSKLLFGAGKIIGFQGSSMDRVVPLQFTTITNGSFDFDHGWLICHGLGILNGLSEIVQGASNVSHRLGVPTIGIISLQHIFRKAEVGVSINCNAVVVIQDDQTPKAQMASKTAGLSRDSFLKASITTNYVGVMIEHVEPGFVELRGQVAFGNGQADRVGDSLSEWASANFDAIRDKGFRVTRSDGPQSSKLGQVLFANVVPRQVKHGVLQGTRMAIGQDESITVDPSGILARVVHDFAPKHMSHGCASHGSTRVT